MPKQSYDDRYRFALHKCAERYRDMIRDREAWDGDIVHAEVRNFNFEFMFGCRDGMPVPKLCRWLGYIQRYVIEQRMTTVEKERDWTRPLFRPLDYGTDEEHPTS